MYIGTARIEFLYLGLGLGLGAPYTEKNSSFLLDFFQKIHPIKFGLKTRVFKTRVFFSYRVGLRVKYVPWGYWILWCCSIMVGISNMV